MHHSPPTTLGVRPVAHRQAGPPERSVRIRGGIGRSNAGSPQSKERTNRIQLGDDAMTTLAATAPHADRIPKNFRTVIIAAAVGNIIEWYDFYIFGSLAAVLAVKFFDKSHPVAALLSTIALFTAGFLIRPLGAFLFGWLGDRVGR